MIICFQGVKALNFKVKEMCYCALMACMMAIFSQIKIDLPGYVPITLQTFMVCLIALIAPCKVAVSACVVYLLMGAIGLPVFAGFQGGMGSLFPVYCQGYFFFIADRDCLMRAFWDAPGTALSPVDAFHYPK